jgi:hypothetical protein
VHVDPCFKKNRQTRATHLHETRCRPTSDSFCGRTRGLLGRRWDGSPDPRQTLRSGVSFRPGPTVWIDLVKKESKKNWGRTLQLCVQYTRHHKYKRRETTSAYHPFHVAVALPCVSGVVYLCRDTFFVSFSTATLCYHCVHIVFLLHDFGFSYSLSTTSC